MGTPIDELKREVQIMIKIKRILLLSAVVACYQTPVSAEILAMVNYETKSADSLKALKNPIATPSRTEGIAIIDPNAFLARFDLPA